VTKINSNLAIFVGHPVAAQSRTLPLPAFGGSQFQFNHANNLLRGSPESFGEFEDGSEAGLLLTQFKDADVSATQVGLETKFLLSQLGFYPQFS
jgi:hypothetical protein